MDPQRFITNTVQFSGQNIIVLVPSHQDKCFKVIAKLEQVHFFAGSSSTEQTNINDWKSVSFTKLLRALVTF